MKGKNSPQLQKKTWQTTGTIWGISLLLTFILFELMGKVLLSSLVPSANVGNGFTTPDSVGFHQIAVKQAEIIRQSGWRAWTAFPENHFPAGYASAIYVLFGTHQETLWGFQAALHATNTLLVFLILNTVFPRFPAWVGSAYYLVYPASLEFTYNLHKDIFFSMGCFLLLWAFLQISPQDKKSFRPWAGTGWIILATVLIKLSRPYVYPLLYLLALLVPLKVFLGNGKEQVRKSIFTAVLVLFSIWVMDKITQDIPSRLVNEANLNKEGEVILTKESEVNSTKESAQRNFSKLERLFKSYQHAREGFNHTEGRSRVDHEFVPKDLREFIFYIPRSLQIGLFSPWPSEWGTPGSSTSATMWKKLLFVYGPLNYIAMGLLLVALVAGPKRIEIGIIVLFCLFVIAFFSLIVSNVGALNRFRNPPYLLLVATGIAWAIYQLIGARNSYPFSNLVTRPTVKKS